MTPFGTIALLLTLFCAAFLALGTGAVYSTFGMCLLATALLLPIACSVRFRRDLGSLVLSSLASRQVVVSLIVFWVLPYYAGRNSADASWYDSQAAGLADLIRAGAWSEIHIGLGSDVVSFLTALMYLPFGPSPEGVVVVSGLVGFIGSLLFVAAAWVSLPENRLRGYAAFVLLLPSILFWSSLFGKDSFIFCGLGICAFAVARWLKYGRWGDLLGIAIGLGAVYAFRPHIALAVALSLTLVEGVRRRQRGAGAKSIAVLALLVPTLIGGVAAVSEFTGVAEVSQESVAARINQQGLETVGGESTVETRASVGIGGFITQLPSGIFRLLFRPFPWEARTIFMFVAALDNLVLIAILIANRSTIMDTLRHLRTQPFALFSCALALLLMMIFSTIPNLGLLARQKTQITPFLYVLAFSGNRREKRHPQSFIEKDSGRGGRRMAPVVVDNAVDSAA